jgi:hypothetical protein
MNKLDDKFVNRMQKLGCCDLDNQCGQHFTFETTEYEELHAVPEKQTYRGKCSQCHVIIKLRGQALGRFIRLYGKSNLVVVKPVEFTELFDVGKKT